MIDKNSAALPLMMLSITFLLLLSVEYYLLSAITLIVILNYVKAIVDINKED